MRKLPENMVPMIGIGDKVRIFVPSHLGYGSQGNGPIPPEAELVFDLEITGITK